MLHYYASIIFRALYTCTNISIYTLVDDEVVIEIVKKHVHECESKGKSWIIQGFPRTKAQALALQKLGIIPDKFILLNCKPSASVSRLKTNLLTIN